MLLPATKQETGAGLWVHYVNKYTEDIGAFEGTGGFRLKPGSAESGFLAEKSVQAARRPGPA